MRIAVVGVSAAFALSFAAVASADDAKPAPPPPKAPAPAAKAPVNLDAPPTPPVPGLAPPPPTPAPTPVFALADASQQTLKEPPLAGWNGAFFLRDPSDYFRFYPRGRLMVDFNSFPGEPTGLAKNGGVNLQPRLFARNLRLELAGQFLQNWTFLLSAEFGGQVISNVDGKNQQSAAAPGTDPTSATARYAQIETVSPNAQLSDAYVNYSVCKCLNFMVGQHDIAFSMENQTQDNVSTFMARSLGLRSFAVPYKKEIGLTVWGEVLDSRLAYGLEVLAGDGTNRPQVDSMVDFSGRIFTRPLFGDGGPLDKLQIGVSGRIGQRDPKFVGYDVVPITTGQGYTLWQSSYTDSQSRVTHILPSGTQAVIGGELRVPFSVFDVRAEAYYVANNTREAINGYQLQSNAEGKPYTERNGQMSGLGWYVQASVWPLGDAFVTGDPGFFRPTTVNLHKEPDKLKRGLEIALRVSGLNADYESNSRGGGADPKSTTKENGSKIEVYEYNVGLNYWYTKYVRATINYTLYQTPGSGSAALNRAVIPQNLGSTGDPKAHTMQELGARVGVWF
ncbi:MAG: porin [Polyangiaceae bacterium]